MQATIRFHPRPAQQPPPSYIVLRSPWNTPSAHSLNIPTNMKDPTYPLVPIANICAAAMIVTTLVSSKLRGAHNRGIVMLAGWVLAQVAIISIQSIVWRDSWQIMIPVFCDITSHLWQALVVGIPACSFLITRRLWHAVQGRELVADTSKTRNEALLEYTLGLGVPFLSMILYYLVQGARFQVIENYGCSSYVYPCGVAILVFQGWLVIFPVLSISLYGWRIIAYLYRHRRITHHLLQQGSTRFQRARYTRIFALACIDVILVLPQGVATTVFSGFDDGVTFKFWPGWDTVKEYWAPQAVTDDEWRSSAIYSFNIYWNQFSGVVLASAIFLLFGLSRDARESYKDAFRRAKSLGALRKTTASRGSTVYVQPLTALSTAHPKIRQTDSQSTITVTKGRAEQSTELDTLSTGPESSPTSLVVVDIEVGRSIDAHAISSGGIAKSNVCFYTSIAIIDLGEQA
ncbi:unnamed protein product [Peniophora sp. CBMAI 1063]|nr:unnamed protein product [Peniophora sp. CBMAI 1063]